MKNVKLGLIAVAAVAMLSAFATRESKDFANIKVRAINQAGTPVRYYVFDANTSNSVWDKQDVTSSTYDCIESTDLCTVTVSDAITPAFDATAGKYYFTPAQVVTNEPGTFQ